MRLKLSAVTPTALAILLACAVGIATAATSGRPARTKSPAPVKPFAHAALSECPNPRGLQPFDAAAARQAETDVLNYGHVSLALDVEDSDRAWQPEVRAMWKSIHQVQPPGQRASIAMNVTLASRSSYRSIVADSCGNRLFDAH